MEVKVFKLKEIKLLSGDVGRFGYKMPRYYRNKLYGQKTRLSRKVADYLHSQSDALCDSALEGLQSERNRSYGEATYLYNMQTDSERLQREREIHSSLAQDYDHSKI